jgi:hypothetical protein
MTEPGTTAQDILGGDILASGRDDWVSMADVQGRISRRQLADSAAERQRLVVDTVPSLLLDGLVEVRDTVSSDTTAIDLIGSTRSGSTSPLRASTPRPISSARLIVDSFHPTLARAYDKSSDPVIDAPVWYVRTTIVRSHHRPRPAF